MRAIKKLLEIIAYLRSKDGCAWDKKQTPESLLPHLEEETWEVMDAVKKKLYKKELKEELADLLLLIVMYSQIASEVKNFDFLAKEQGKKYHPLERVPASSSAAYLFKKLKSFETEKFEINLEEIERQIQSLKKETDKKKFSTIMGKNSILGFFELARDGVSLS